MANGGWDLLTSSTFQEVHLLYFSALHLYTRQCFLYLESKNRNIEGIDQYSLEKHERETRYIVCVLLHLYHRVSGLYHVMVTLPLVQYTDLILNVSLTHWKKGLTQRAV